MERKLIAQWNSGLSNHSGHNIFVVRFGNVATGLTGWGIECDECDEVIYEEPAMENEPGFEEAAVV